MFFKPEKAKIKIFMVGGRRCGKTTVLSSMWKNADKMLFETGLSLETTNTQAQELQNTIDQSESYFDDPEMESFVYVSDDNANSQTTPFNFKLKLAGKKTGIEIQFVDVPGEFFVNPEHFAEVKQHIRESHVIIFAIDTPCLMEDMSKDVRYGKRHVMGNKSENIIHFLKRELDVNAIKDRLLLFVPIKCEKYYYAGQIAKVVDAVKAGYKELLDYISTDGLKNNCTAAVLPILSLGGLEFFGFANQSESPTASQEYIYYANDGNLASYKPKYCDQPLLYTIAYALKIKGKNTGPWGSLMNFLTGNGKALAKALQLLMEKVNREEGNGFVMLQNPLSL